MKDKYISGKVSEYDTKVKKIIPYYDSFHYETIQLIDVIKPAVACWLDTGCGTGNLAEKIMSGFPNCKLFLSDPSEEMLQICKTKFSNQQVEILGNYKTIDIPQNIKPEVITAIQCHHYLNFENRFLTTKHCYDLLSSDGIYICFENIRPNTNNGIKIGLNQWANYQKINGRTKNEIEKHIDRFDKEYFPIKVNEHIDIMRKAGFETVELFWKSYMQAGFYGIKK